MALRYCAALFYYRRGLRDPTSKSSGWLIGRCAADKKERIRHRDAPLAEGPLDEAVERVSVVLAKQKASAFKHVNSECSVTFGDIIEKNDHKRNSASPRNLFDFLNQTLPACDHQIPNE
jgi:hypothetical protein